MRHYTCLILKQVSCCHNHFWILSSEQNDVKYFEALTYIITVTAVSTLIFFTSCTTQHCIKRKLRKINCCCQILIVCAQNNIPILFNSINLPPYRTLMSPVLVQGAGAVNGLLSAMLGDNPSIPTILFLVLISTGRLIFLVTCSQMSWHLCVYCL